jgi:CheY-like chemotaxis protein
MDCKRETVFGRMKQACILQMHRILIVDDHPTLRRVLRSLFESNGFDGCGEAVRGVDAIEKAQELRPDLILLDLSMPVMDGLEAARQLNNLMPEVPLMMLTNHAGSILETDALNAGIRRVIPKDKAFDMLMSATQDILA